MSSPTRTRVSKRELNQSTAQVLAAVDASDEPLVITEHGVPRWEIRRIESLNPADFDDPLDFLEATGWQITRPAKNPRPLPTIDPELDPERIQRLLAEERADRI